MRYNPERFRLPQIESPHVYQLNELTSYLSMFVKAQQRAGKPCRIVLATYNRIGDGTLPPKTVRGHLALEAYQGSLGHYPSSEEAVAFYIKLKEKLLDQVCTINMPTFFVVYGGDSVRFQAAVDLISEVSSMAHLMGKKDVIKFYLLVCNCGLEKKVKLAEPLYQEELLRYVVFNPMSECGGFADLKTIAEAVLKAVPSTRCGTGGRAAPPADDFLDMPPRGLVC